MKRNLIFLNVAIIIPCLLQFAGIFPVEMTWVFLLIISIINIGYANKKTFLICNLILLLCTTVTIIAQYYERKIYGVGFHPGVTEEYQLLIVLNIGFVVLLAGIGMILKSLPLHKGD